MILSGCLIKSLNNSSLGRVIRILSNIGRNYIYYIQLTTMLSTYDEDGLDYFKSTVRLSLILLNLGACNTSSYSFKDNREFTTILSLLDKSPIEEVIANFVKNALQYKNITILVSFER